MTGGAGFIGSHLVDGLLALGHRVRVLDDLSTGREANIDSRVQFQRGTVADPSTVVAAMDGIDEVYHLAAVASVQRCNTEWFAAHRINQSASVAVFDAARDRGRIPVVYASSAAVYGDTDGVVAHEGLPPSPLSAYGVDKLGSELHARVATRIHGVPTLGLRFFNVYGPRQDPYSPYSGVISIFALNLAQNKPIMLHGDGSQTRDFVHVSDAVAHLQAAMERLRADPTLAGCTLNVCTGRATSVRDLALMLGELRGAALQIRHAAPRPGDIRHSCGAPERAATRLGLRAGTTLETGLLSVL